LLEFSEISCPLSNPTENDENTDVTKVTAMIILPKVA
jgi:hypothetical protein